MAKPSWLKLNPSTGSGNGTIANSADAHTGRTARTGTVTVTGVGVSTPSTYKVTQSPKSEFASFDNGSEMSAPVMECGESRRADKMAKSPVPVATSKIRQG